MKVCPKCRSFYADESLEFCLNDGFLLSGVNANEKIWETGQKFLRTSNKLKERRKRIYLIKKVFVYTVTTVIFTAVVAVVLINTIIILTPNDVEIAENDLPTPQSNSVTLTPTPDSVTQIPTPDSATTTPTPTTCNKEIEINSVRTDNLSLWTNNVEEQRAKFENDYALIESKYGQIDIKKGLNDEIAIGKDCLTAAVKLNYTIFAEIQGVKSPIDRDNVKLPIAGITNYNCNKDEKWNCSIIITY